MIIDNNIRELVSKIEKSSIKNMNFYIKELIQRLEKNCKLPKVKMRYEYYRKFNSGKIKKYPIENDGYGKSFDPLLDEQYFFDCWSKYGIVIGKSVVSIPFCNNAKGKINAMVKNLSNGKCDLSKYETYSKIPIDHQGIPILSRGFFEIYHDNLLAQIRQSIRVYLHYVLIWGRTDLWTSFDRLGVKLSSHKESYSLPLHIDQNPKIHTNFKTVQGVLALDDCPIERGTFVAVPGSRKYFLDYIRMAPEKGEYVELDTSDRIAAKLKKKKQALPLRKGDLVTWDSRTTHSNTGNISRKTRFVAYVAMGPAKENNRFAIKARKEAFKTGLGSNVREALMHASKKPRYTNQKAILKIRKKEKLTLLGELIYGQKKYKKI